MASKTINTILNLQDKMSPKLIKVSSKVKALDKDTQRATQKMANMANKWSSSVDKMVGKAGKLALNFAKVGVAVATTAAAAGSVQLVKQSDAYSGIQARLKLINDGQQTVEQFNEKIFKSADRARASYVDMASIIGKLGVTAGSAFKNNDEILKFSELLSKNFKISGASAEEQSAAMYQLTQAMGAGKLQGDEFRSIMENAPLLAQAIAKEMKVPIGQLKEMSSEGVITSDIIKSALFNSADDIEQKFKGMPVTFAESVTKIKNQMTNKLQPTFQKLSKWLNGKDGKKFVDGIVNGIGKLAGKIPDVVKAFKDIYDNAKKVYDFINKYQDLFIVIGSFAGSLYLVGKAFYFVTGAMKAAQLAGLLLNGTLALSPIGWIALSIAALVTGIILLIKYWDKLKKTFKNTTTPNYNSEGKPIGRKVITRNALGTQYWRGGIASINERGGEIVDLPNGSRVIPADKSKKITNSRSITFGNIYITAKGITTDEVFNEVVPRLKLAIENM